MSSPRARLLAAFGDCLGRISTTNGYLTDAGTSWTTEPQQVDAAATAVLTAVIDKQQRATDAALVRTHRLTTVAVIGKVPASLENYQQRLDDLVTDIEAAMDEQQQAFPSGLQYPVYVAMEPLSPDPGAGWMGVAVSYQSHIPKK